MTTTSTRPLRFPGESVWLGQFDKNDKTLAETLLDVIRFVPQDEFVRWVSSTLIDLNSTLNAPLAVYAIREPSGSYFPTHRGHRPTAVIGKSVGSEGVVAQRIERLSRGRPDFFSHPSLSTLKRRRIRDVVLVDDSVGSGDRVLKFLANLHEHPTTRSWASRHLLRFWVVAYMATDQGKDAVAAAVGAGRGARLYSHWLPLTSSGVYRTVRRHRPRIYPNASVNFLSATAGPRCDERIHSLAERYGRRFKLRYRSGHKRAFTLVVYDHGCPNTAPGILWESRARWAPLFPERTVTIPSGVLVPPSAPPAGGQGQLSSDARVVLAELVKGIRYPNRVARSTGIPREAVLAALAELRGCNLVVGSRVAARRLEIELPTTKPDEDVTGSGASYIPTQLRGASNAF